MSKVKVGLLCIGLDTYWAQFEGLLDKLVSYNHQIKSYIEKMNVEIVDGGMVDSPVKAVETVDRMHGVELLFIYISTYALSSTVLPIAQAAKCKTVLLNIQPTAAIDYGYANSLGDRGRMTGEWLAKKDSYHWCIGHVSKSHVRFLGK